MKKLIFLIFINALCYSQALKFHAVVVHDTVTIATHDTITGSIDSAAVYAAMDSSLMFNDMVDSIVYLRIYRDTTNNLVNTDYRSGTVDSSITRFMSSVYSFYDTLTFKVLYNTKKDEICVSSNNLTNETDVLDSLTITNILNSYSQDVNLKITKYLNTNITAYPMPIYDFVNKEPIGSYSSLFFIDTTKRILVFYCYYKYDGNY